MSTNILSHMIATLDNSDKQAIFDHLIRLDKNDRFMRFFVSAPDSFIERYVFSSMDLTKSKAFGIFDINDKKTLIALAHVSSAEELAAGKSAELGISVDKQFRGMGLAKRLMDRTLIYCKAKDIGLLYMSCLRSNKAMQHLATTTGMKVVLDHDEAMATIKMAEFPLEKMASISHEIAYEQIAIIDKCYRLNKTFVESLLRGENHEQVA